MWNLWNIENKHANKLIFPTNKSFLFWVCVTRDQTQDLKHAKFTPYKLSCAPSPFSLITCHELFCLEVFWKHIFFISRIHRLPSSDLGSGPGRGSPGIGPGMSVSCGALSRQPSSTDLLSYKGMAMKLPGSWQEWWTQPGARQVLSTILQQWRRKTVAQSSQGLHGGGVTWWPYMLRWWSSMSHFIAIGLLLAMKF
jgi:hypothetical protein